MSIPSTAIETATRVSIAGCTACRCSLITVRLHDEEDAIFAAFQMDAAGGRTFIGHYQAEIEKAEQAGFGAIRCEGIA